MDFLLSSEQTLLQDSALRFVEGAYDFDQYRRSFQLPGQCDAAIWQQIADLGWLALSVPEAVGGFAGSVLDVALVAEALGAGLVLESFVAGAVVPSVLLTKAGSEEQQLSALEPLMEGRAQLALAYAERAGRFNPAYCALTAVRQAGGYRLAGGKHCVLNAPNAEYLIVSAREAHSPGSAAGITLFLVNRAAAGVLLTPYAVHGGGIAADIQFLDVFVPDSARLMGGYDALEAALDVGIVAECARALGAMNALYRRTFDYTNTRKQFGNAISTNQVIQHRLVDMFIELEQSRSMVLMAAAKLESAVAVERHLAASSAKVYLCKASRFVSQEAMQLHGGIGMTEELDVGHYFRLLTGFWSRYGDQEFHLNRLDSLEYR